MQCPRCGKETLRPAGEILKGLDTLYMACGYCPPDPCLSKTAPGKSLSRKDLYRCHSCGRAPLDLVMFQVLDILVEREIREEGDPLRSVGTPLTAIGYPFPYPPRLGKGDLLLLIDEGDDALARDLMRIPEIKGVIAGQGIPGVLESGRSPHQWKLLAGCDMRADVIQGVFGELVIYKAQSQVHIEYPRHGAPKIRKLERLNIMGMGVLDGMAGPGTLGLYCILAGARRIILNDIWLPAVENIMLNLEANREELELEKVERLARPQCPLGCDPVLVGRARGRCSVEVYHGDLALLLPSMDKLDLCLLDPFPGAPFQELRQKAAVACQRVEVI